MRSFPLLFLLAVAVQAQEISVPIQILNGTSFLDNQGRVVSVYGVVVPPAQQEAARSLLEKTILSKLVTLSDQRAAADGTRTAKVGLLNWDIGATLIDRGLAQVAASTYQDYIRLRNEAARAGVGLWSSSQGASSSTRLSGDGAAYSSLIGSLTVPATVRSPAPASRPSSSPPKARTSIYSEPPLRYYQGATNGQGALFDETCLNGL